MLSAGAVLWSATMAIGYMRYISGYTGDRRDGPRRRRRRVGARLPARGRRPRGAPRLSESSRSAGTASSSSSSPRTLVAAATRVKDTSTSTSPREHRSRSGPARTPWTDPGHDTEIPRESNGPPSWRRRGAVVLRLSPPSGATSHENRSTRRRGGRGSPRTTSTRLGSGGAILRAAHDARGAGQPPFTRQPEQSARPQSEGRDQVR